MPPTQTQLSLKLRDGKGSDMQSASCSSCIKGLLWNVRYALTAETRCITVLANACAL